MSKRQSAFRWFRGTASALVLLAVPVVATAYLAPWADLDIGGVRLPASEVRPFPALEIGKPPAARTEIKARGDFLAYARDGDSLDQILSDVFKDTGFKFRTLSRQRPNRAGAIIQSLESSIDGTNWQNWAMDLTSLTVGVADYVHIAPISPLPAIGPYLIGRSTFSQLWSATDDSTTAGMEFPVAPNTFFAGTAVAIPSSAVGQPRNVLSTGAGTGGDSVTSATFAGTAPPPNQASTSNLSPAALVR